MYEDWKVLHLDEVESENILFCRALSEAGFAGHCESVQNIPRAQAYLEHSLFTPQSLSRPDIIVINWHNGGDVRGVEFVRWIRSHPQFRATPILVFITEHLPFAVQEQAEEAGVTEMIVRPKQYGDLLPQVKALLERHASRFMTKATVALPEGA